jgi:predicted Na+-dependent transporter
MLSKVLNQHCDLLIWISHGCILCIIMSSISFPLQIAPGQVVNLSQNLLRILFFLNVFILLLIYLITN